MKKESFEDRRSRRLKLKDVGEKKIISDYIIPMFSKGRTDLKIGDDCAIYQISEDCHLCMSTDRVPFDLIYYKLGLIDLYGLGKYLAVLNISDIAACGADPIGVLANIAANGELPLDDFLDVLKGVNDACMENGCVLLGGDISDSSELNLVGTSIGICRKGKPLLRSTATAGDKVFCSRPIGLIPAAFAYHLKLKETGFSLAAAEEAELGQTFLKPEAMVSLGQNLSKSGNCTSCMDNTDGIGQSLIELGQMSNVAFRLDENEIPVHPLCVKVADALGVAPLDLAFSAGGDLQLLGSASDLSTVECLEIGTVVEGEGLQLITKDGKVHEIHPAGWNYFN